jgi:hypothetical protein
MEHGLSEHHVNGVFALRAQGHTEHRLPASSAVVINEVAIDATHQEVRITGVAASQRLDSLARGADIERDALPHVLDAAKRKREFHAPETLAPDAEAAGMDERLKHVRHLVAPDARERCVLQVAGQLLDPAVTDRKGVGVQCDDGLELRADLREQGMKRPHMQADER